jgi:hypothetical protein
MEEDDRTRWGDAAIRFATVVGLALVAVVPIVGNELRVQDVDAIYMRNLVERAGRYGGTYYENTIHNRGTFEPLLFDLARRVSSYDGYWFAVSFIVVVLAAILGFVAARTARCTGANRSIALGVAAAVYVQFALAGHGYSRVLYIRNVTTCLLAFVWVIALAEGCWSSPRRARWSAIAVGALLGLVVEQLLTSVFCGAVVGLVALALLYERRPAEERGGLLLRSMGAAVAGLLVTPAWYVVRGGFAEYWSGWWTYARFMSDGPGRSLGSQIALGWDRCYEYHLRNPLVVLLLVAFVGTTWLIWGELERKVRVVHVGLGAWYVAGWVELIFSQRYSAHYYMVIAVPTAFIGAALAGHLTRAVAALRPSAVRLSLGVPLAATVLALYMTGPANFVQSVKDTNKFSSVSEWARNREDYLGGGDRTVRSILDLVSEQDDGLLAWTFDPFVYTRYERVPATRFQWKWLFQGAIYLGRTSPDYVLPQTWTWFKEDVAESHPAAFVETEPFDAGTPFDSLIRSTYHPTYTGSAGTVWLTSAARDALTSSQGRAWTDQQERIGDSGWAVDGTTARYASGPVPGDGDALYLGSGTCIRYEGTADVSAPGPLADLILRFDSRAHPEEERQTLALEGTKAGSGSAGLGPMGFESIDANVHGDGPVHFAVVVGRHSAALVVDGEVQAAVRLRDTVVRLTLESRTPEVTLSDLRVGAAPAGGGCTASPTLPAP